MTSPKNAGGSSRVTPALRVPAGSEEDINSEDYHGKSNMEPTTPQYTAYQAPMLHHIPAGHAGPAPEPPLMHPVQEVPLRPEPLAWSLDKDVEHQSVLVEDLAPLVESIAESEKQDMVKGASQSRDQQAAEELQHELPMDQEDTERKPKTKAETAGAIGEPKSVGDREERIKTLNPKSERIKTPLGSPTERLILPFVQAPMLDERQLPPTHGLRRRSLSDWAIRGFRQLATHPAASVLLLVAGYFAIHAAWTASPPSEFLFGSTTVSAGIVAAVVAGAVVIAAAVAPRSRCSRLSVSLVAVPESQMMSMDDPSGSAPVETLGLVSGGRTERDGRGLRRSLAEGEGLLKMVEHYVEDVAHEVYEDVMEVLDPGMEMVGEVIQEDEDPMQVKEGESDAETGIERIQEALKEGGYTSDSDAPGPVMSGVHHHPGK